MNEYKKSAWMVAGLALAAPAMAADIDLSFIAGNTYSDNVLLLSEGGPSDNIGGAAMKLDFSAQGARYDAELRSAFTYLHYFNDTLDSELLRGFAGELNLAFVPGRFVWVVQENYGPVLEDPLSPDRPDNWTYDSYFSTGPDVQFGDAGGFHVIASGRYSRADYENSEVPPSEQLTGELTFALPGTERSERSLNVNAQRVEQGEGTNGNVDVTQDYDRQEAFLRLASDFTRTSLFVEAGGTMLHDAGETASAPLLRFGIDRNLSRTLSLFVAGGTQYSDNLSRFGRLQDGAPSVDQPRGDITRVTDPMQEDFAEATLDFRGTRTVAALRVAYNVLDFQNSNSPLASQEYRDITLDVNRQITPRLHLNAGGSFAHRQFNELARTDDDTYGYAAFGWLLTSDLTMQLTGRLTKRDSSDPTAEFTERSVQLEFVYQAITRKSERPRNKIKHQGLR